MELLACDCKRKCVTGSCSCVDNNLKCTDACALRDYENTSTGDDIDDDSESDFDVDEDDEEDWLIFSL